MRERGFALLIVLWTLVLLSLITATMTASGGMRARQAGDLRRNVQLEALADGAVDEAIFHLLDQSRGAQSGYWPADGALHVTRRGGVQFSIRMFNEAGKINPNQAQSQLLAALIQAVGGNATQAATVSINMLSWRFAGAGRMDFRPGPGEAYTSPGAPFESLQEIGLVPGVTPQLLAALIPHLSIYHDGDPDYGIADPMVLRALEIMSGPDAALAATANANQGTHDESAVTVSVLADDGLGHRARRQAIVATGQTNNQGNQAEPMRIMTWDSPPV